MKIIFYISLIFLGLNVYGQIEYRPVFINQCTNEVESSVHWYLAKDKNYYFTNRDEIVILPKVGFYNLYSERDEFLCEVKILENSIAKDTFFLKRIEIFEYVSNPPVSVYAGCNGLAKGEVVDYYSNGNIRLKGHFRKGQPIDSIFKYRRDGILLEILIPKKRKFKRITYYENGSVKYILDTKRRYKKWFYPNGKLKRKERWNRNYKTTSIKFYKSESFNEDKEGKNKKLNNQN